METLTDINRVLPAARIDGVIHHTYVNRNHRIVTKCGLLVRFEDLMIMAQRPEDISCKDCKGMIN